jgi:hypothetical protein
MLANPELAYCGGHERCSPSLTAGANYEQGHGQAERNKKEAGEVTAGEARRQEGEEREPRVSDLKEKNRRCRQPRADFGHEREPLN